MGRQPNQKSFDCIQFKREAQAKIFEDIKDLPQSEQVEYFKKLAETGPLGEWWESVKAQTTTETQSSS